MMLPEVEAGYGVAKGTNSFATGAAAATQAMNGIKECPLVVVLVFASVKYDLEALLNGVHEVVGDVTVIGATTAGEICNEPQQGSVVVVALASPYLKVRVGLGQKVSKNWRQAVNQAVSSPEVEPFFSPHNLIWQELALQGKSTFAMLFSPGNTKSADSLSFEILEELTHLSRGYLPIFGGSAADDWQMEANYTFWGQRAYIDSVLVAVFETQLRFGLAMAHGFHASSRKATVTLAHNHKVLEINGEQAAEVYSRLHDFPRETLEGKHLSLTTKRPMGILDAYGQYRLSVASFFTDEGGVRFAQPTPEGTVLTVMEEDLDSVVPAGSEALRKALLRGAVTDPRIALVFSCALRKQILGERIGEEIEAIKNMIPGVPVVGFYSFGEQGQSDDGVNRHNNVMAAVLTLGRQFSFGAQVALGNEQLRVELEQQKVKLMAANEKLLHEIAERRRAEGLLLESQNLLEEVSEELSTLSPDYDTNFMRLTALCGRLLGATCALYNRLQGEMLCSLGVWQTPPDYVPEDRPEGHICYDVIRNRGREPIVIRNLPDTPYMASDPNVSRYGLMTYVGYPVWSGDKPVGSLCAVFQADVAPSQNDLRAMELIASAISREEERKLADELLKLNELRLEALVNLNQMANASLPEIAQFAMEEATRLTASKIGYVTFMNEDETVLTMHAWSRAAMAECSIDDKPLLYPVETTGLWGEAVRQRRPIITNDYAGPNPWKKGYPKGHVDVIRHMNVPIFDSDKIVIVAGVGNKPSDYDESDIRQLTLLMEGMWRIVQRKEAEEELQREKERYLILTEESPVGVALIGVDGNYRYINPKFIEMFGYTLDDIPTGKDWFAKAYTRADDRREALSFWLKDLQASRVGESRPRTFRVTCKDGSQKIINFRPVTLESGNQLVIYEDVTGLAVANEALREREETLSVLIDSNPESLLLLDTQGTVLAANATAAERIGKRLEEMQGSIIWDLLPAEVLSGRKAHIAKVVATGKPIQFEDIRQGRYFSTYCHPVLDSQGKVSRIAVLGVDLTEHKEAEKLLRESEQRYRQLVNQIPAVVYKGYLDWSLECFDQKIEEITGYSMEEFNTHQKTWLDLIFPEDVGQVRELLLGALKGDGSYVTEHRIRKNNGDIRWVEVRNQIILDASGKIDYISGVLFDITERKKLEDQLIKAQRMEAVGILAGGLAHDFNNLLTAIMGYSEIMMMDLRKGDPFLSSLEEVTKAANRGAQLTNQLLAFSRKQILQPRVINLNDVVIDMDRMLRRLIGEDIDLVTFIDEELGWVKADPGQLEQILMNLAVNARDAMPQGGKLTIETANVYLDQDYVGRHEGVTPGPHVMLAISDNGVGMDADTLAHIFEPFYTTKEAGKGTGLGLATVYGIVKQSGGHIWVYSEPGKNTTFKVYLPRVEGKEKDHKPKPAVPTPLEGNETILVVEDDAALRELTSMGLRKYGFKVLEAAQGGEALLICEREKAPIHLMLTDVVMPKISGSALAERSKLLHPEMKVLFMSGYTENAIVRHGVLDSKVNFIAKPFRVQSLVQKIREVLDTPQSV